MTPPSRAAHEHGHLLPDLHDGIPFWKMSGSGNDFVVLDNRYGALLPDDLASFTRAVCRHRLSVGADGVVVIEAASDDHDVDFAWRYINADGSEGEFCGNGAMCGARYAALHGIAPFDCRFLTPAGVVHAHVSEDSTDPRVSLRIANPGPVGSSIDVGVTHAGQTVSVTLSPIVVGVPHVVAVVDDIADPYGLSVTESERTPTPNDYDLATVPPTDPMFVAVGRAIRHDPTFAPAGTNVNTIQVLDDHTVRMRTYERGVEDETLACGSGAVASACVALARGLVSNPVTVITSSGRPLHVSGTWDPETRQATDVMLTGEARVIVAGVIGPEALQ